MHKIIDSFTGPFRFLSNFYPVDILYEGIHYPSTEHAFQAAKTTDEAARFTISLCPTPGYAKRAGKRVVLRENWDNLKYGIMHELVNKKFGEHRPDLRQKLLETGYAILIEGNTWGDETWGCTHSSKLHPTEWAGKNWLGKILMDVRDDIVRSKMKETGE